MWNSKRIEVEQLQLQHHVIMWSQKKFCWHEMYVSVTGLLQNMLQFGSHIQFKCKSQVFTPKITFWTLYVTYYNIVTSEKCCWTWNPKTYLASSKQTNKSLLQGRSHLTRILTQKNPNLKTVSSSFKEKSFMVRESLRIRMTQRNVEPCLGKLHDVGTLTSRQTGTKKREAWATDVHMAIGNRKKIRAMKKIRQLGNT